MEILNLEYNLALDTLKALNKTNTHEEACKLLGISDRTLYRRIKIYGIRRENINTNYALPEVTFAIVPINLIRKDEKDLIES